MSKVNMETVVKVGKVVGKFAGPVLVGIMAAGQEIKSANLEETVKGLVKKVAEMEAKMK